MYAYAVAAMDTSGKMNVELCFGIYVNEKKAFAVAKDLNDKAKEIQILKHSGDNKRELERLTNEYEKILRDKFNDKNSLGIYYYNEDAKYYWDVKQISIVE